MSDRASWRTLAAWSQGDRMDDEDDQRYENDTPKLDALLGFALRQDITDAADAQAELRYLKVQHAKLLLDYYAEYNGVPRNSWNWNDDQILAWAAAEYERVSKP